MRGGRGPLKLGRWGSKGNSESPWRFSLWNSKKPFSFSKREMVFENVLCSQQGAALQNAADNKIRHRVKKGRTFVRP
jgi:hypothetical protein